MTNIKSFEKFIEFFNSNAGGVISTITNQQIIFNFNRYIDFDYSVIESNISIPCILTNIDFAGSNDFQLTLLTSKRVVAAFADLMMLGTGDIDYSPEEHNDAMKEIFNQVFGSLSTELNAEDVNVVCSASDVDLSDLEMQKEFLKDTKMIELSFTLLKEPAFLYITIDDETEKILDNLFKQKTIEKPQASKQPTGFQQKPNLDSAGTISVSRASFSEIEEVSPSNSKNINLDNLLDIPLPITVELGRKEMRIKDILDLGQGAIVELTKLAGDLVDLYINGKKFAVGEVMVVDENYAVRIVNLISREERIRSLGPE